MKWYRFKHLVSQHSWLPELVGQFCGDYDSASLSSLREFVRGHIGYVAHRPTSTLDLDLVRGHYETTTSFAYAITCDPYYGGNREAAFNEQWDIVWRIGHALPTPNTHRDGQSLRDDINQIRSMVSRQSRIQDREVCIDFVVRSVFIEEPNRLPNLTVEIYPLSLVIQPIPVQPVRVGQRVDAFY